MRFPRKTVIITGAAVTVTVILFLIYENVHSRIIFGIREDFARPIAYDQPVPGIPGVRAEQCGLCHREIYEEWLSSYHAKAWEDPFFQAYWRKDEKIWICLNCHTPMEPQQEWLIQGLEGGKIHKPIRVKNPNFDPEYQKEGITCAVCHVRDGVIEGPYGNTEAPHPTRFSARFRSTDICFTCHQVPSGPFQFYEGGPCSTFPEYEAGPYYKSGTTCQDCHMPFVQRPIVPGGPVRDTRRHLWQGGHFPEMIKRAVTVDLTANAYSFQPGQVAEFTLRLINSGAGHKLPTGDPDRYFTITFEVIDPEGKVLKHDEYTMGRWIIWKPFIIEVYENRLMPLAYRDYLFRYRLPKKMEGLKMRTMVKYHIMTDKQYRKLQTDYGLSVEVPYVFTIFKKEVRLGEPIPRTAARRDPSGLGCETSS